MTSTFYGLPLPRRGESFLLRTHDRGQERAVLVDAGYEARSGTSPLYKQLRRQVPNLKTIHRFICTHEDADHCEGAPEFLRTWIGSKRSVEQVWLPGLWSAVGRTTSRKDWIKILVGALEAAPAIQETLSILQEQGDDGTSFELELEAIEQVAEKLNLSNELTRIREEGAPAEQIAEEGQYVDPEDDWSWANSVELDRRISPHTMSLVSRLAIAALSTHYRISRIVAVCRQHGILIRWFDFHQFKKLNKPSGGDAGFLTPVNSVEVLRINKASSPLLLFLALSLSRANVESLVFLRNETDSDPGVLFTADSRLTFGLSRPGKPFPKPTAGMPLRLPLLVTAMHHGAASNEPGYGVLTSWLGGTNSRLVVRNGGDRIGGIAPSFFMESRFCVWCHKSSRNSQLVKVDSSGGVWNAPINVLQCVCSN